MSIPLRILVVEDSENDTLLLMRELHKADYEPMYERVETAEAFNKMLYKMSWDIIISDYSMPEFNGLNALKILLKSKLKIPFIIVSGAIGEEQAVELIKTGANDYVLKNNIGHLGSVVRRVLFEARIQLEQKKAEEAIQQANQEWEELFQAIGQPSFVLNPQHEILAINRVAVEMIGKPREELLGKKCFEVFHNDNKPAECCPMEKLLSSGRYESTEMSVEAIGHTFLVACTPWYDKNGKLEKVIHIATDITESKAAEKALKESEMELALRNKIADVFLTASDDDLYERMLNIILEVMDSGFGLLGYVSDDGHLVCPSMTRDVWDKCRVPDKTFNFHPDTWRDSIWSQAILEKKSLYSNLSGKVPDGHIGISKSLAVPIIYQEEVIGLIHLANKEKDYDDADVKRLEVIADYIAPILESKLQRNREERKRHLAEDEVRKERDKAQNYLDVAEVMFVAINAEQKVTLINKKGCEILGYTEDELLDANWFDTCLPINIRNNVKTVYNQLMSGEQIQAAEYYENPVITKNGEEKLIAWHNTILKDSKGNIIGALSSGEDITEEKRTEISLKENEAKYRTLFQNMSSGFAYHKIIVDENGKPVDYVFLEINEAFEKLTGLSRDILDKKVSELLPGIEKSETDFIGIYGNVALSGQPAKIESYAEPLNRWYSITAYSPEKNYFVAVFDDITERKTVEKERLTNLHYSESMNQISEIMIQTLDLEKVIHSLVCKLLTIFNSDRAWLQHPCDPAAVSWKMFNEASVPQYPGLFTDDEEVPMRPVAKEIFTDALASNAPITYVAGKNQLPGSDNYELWGKYSIKSQLMIAIRPRIGKPWLLGLHQCSYAREWNENEKRLFQDISYRFTDALNNLLLFQDLRHSEKSLQTAKKELERQNEELKALDKIKDGLVRDVTHEMKTPVAKQNMQIEMLKQVVSKHGLNKECGKMLDTMRKSVRRQESVINNILNLSRLEAGGRKYQLEPMRLDLLLNDVVSDYREMIDSLGIKIEIDLPPTTIISDREMLFHVFSNLINNAIKYRNTSDNCWIGVFLKENAKGATIRIENNGIELTDEVKEKAFDKFYQASASSEGSGVGLTIAKMIIDGLKGKIWLEYNSDKSIVAAVVEIPITERIDYEEKSVGR